MNTRADQELEFLSTENKLGRPTEKAAQHDAKTAAKISCHPETIAESAKSLKTRLRNRNRMRIRKDK